MSVSSLYMLASDNPSRDQIKKCNVGELQNFLTTMGLNPVGKKSDLVDRVFQFFSDLKEPKQNDSSTPTSAVSFSLSTQPDYSVLRRRLESFGQISAIIVDPGNATCYVSYQSSVSSAALVSKSSDLGLKKAKYILESELEKVAGRLKLIPEGSNFANVVQRNFQRTSCEPRLFWKPVREDPHN